ncbi:MULTISPECIES: type I polyketide synthase [Catenuloplanes]|uniref:type I polyketide synthase n=1 Tax=Catenuloplanes TaxID=33874 RepID=UPI00286D6141|nr:beta-ketoacyl synthase N-terminal-like domain-containing protein [Catenuloplanes niger]
MFVEPKTLRPPAGAAQPVAVVGIGCRFPGGVNSPDEFWELLSGGRNTTGEVPAARWEPYRDLGPDFEAALRRANRSGSFLDGIDGFDAEFFGISPREAELMDPQQRLLLEVAWQALEHAGIPPRELAGTDTGVFAGVCTYDYGAHQLEDLPHIDAWTGIGAATCAVSNRISHALDLRGPSLTVDTACSASLVALHLAAQSLRLGESTVALVGGANLIVTPGQSITLGAAGALAPDGRSKSFDATADGYGRGEGCGVVVLKLLADAERDGDRVLAVLRGSAVNQDGHTNGIMAPCGTAQAHVMERALRYGGVEPGAVDYVEAHGTGTPVGDPMEATAIGDVYGQARSDGDPCLIGSVKSNIGHLEGAAGVAGVIKAVLALDRGEIPATLLVTEVNPAIAWDKLRVRVVTRNEPWPDRDGPRRAGVSGFGYGGTVAHAVFEQAPPVAPPAVSALTGASLFPVSAASAAALRDQAAALADWLTDDADLASVGHTLAVRRSHLAYRAVAVAADAPGLRAALRGLASGEPADGVVTGSPLGDGPKLVWVFSGHGSQWSGMGRELLDTEPAFAAAIDALEPVFLAEIGFSPRQALRDGEFDAVDRIQTMIFAVQLGLAAMWRARGVTPDAVIGHSVGEIAAAVTAGVLTVEDGARLICRRSILLRRVAGRGAMAMVSLPFAQAAARLAGRTDVVAAIASSPSSTVVSGDPAALDALVRTWADEGLVTRRVASDVAFHSPHMDELVDELAAAVDFTPGSPRIPIYPTALDDPRAPMTADGAYWAGNLRNPVRLADAVTAASADGFHAFLEVSPHPVVTHSIHETLAELDEDTYVGVTLRRHQPETRGFLTALAGLHCAGVEIDRLALHPRGDLVTLPVYRWRHRSHWHHPAPVSRAGGRGHDPDSHTLLGARRSLAGSAVQVWGTGLDDANRPYPGSHTLNGVEIVPAAVLVVTFLAAAERDGVPPVLAGLAMRHPLMTAGRREIQVVREGGDVRLASRTTGGDAGEDPPWLVHADATVRAGDPDALAARALVDPAEYRLEPADPGLIHRRLAEVGVPSTGFGWSVDHLLAGYGVLRARVRTDETSTWASVLDAVMSIAPAAYPGMPQLRMVVWIDEVTTVGLPPATVLVEVRLDEDRPDTVDALVATEDGRVLAALPGLRYPVIDQPPAPAAGDEASDPEPVVSFADLPPDELRERVLAEVREQIAAEMRLAADDLHPRRPLAEQGLDSVMTVVIRRRLEKRLGLALPATVFWQQPTVTAIADHVTGLLATVDRVS